jgi:molecular chaperone GrpE (heat shock protein)
MEENWLKLYRKAIDSQVFSDPDLWHLFCWCLLKANWRTGWYYGQEIHPGSFATGRDSASKELNINAQTWYKRIKKLESIGVISVFSNNRFSVITVQKWADYQSRRDAGNNGVTTEEQQSNNGVTTEEQQSNTIEEGYIPKKDRNTHTHTQSENAKIDKAIQTAWSRWCEYRLAIDGREPDPVSSQANLMELERRGAEKAVSDIDFSIRKNAKSILDSSNDFERRSTSPNASNHKPKWMRSQS